MQEMTVSHNLCINYRMAWGPPDLCKHGIVRHIFLQGTQKKKCNALSACIEACIWKPMWRQIILGYCANLENLDLKQQDDSLCTGFPPVLLLHSCLWFKREFLSSSAFFLLCEEQQYFCNSSSVLGIWYSLEILVSRGSFGSLDCCHFGELCSHSVIAVIMLWECMELSNTV